MKTSWGPTKPPYDRTFKKSDFSSLLELCCCVLVSLRKQVTIHLLLIVYLMCWKELSNVIRLSPPPICLPYSSNSRSFNSLICVGSASQAHVYGAGPHAAVFTSGCINSVSCCSIWIMKAAAAGPLRARNKRPCLPFSRTLSFCFLSSQQLLSRGSHTPKPHAFNHAHEVRVCYNGPHQFPGVYRAKSCSCCCVGQGGLCLN